MGLVALYYCVFTPATTLLENYLAETLLRNEYLVTGINMALNLSTEYLYNRFVVFGKSVDTRKQPFAPAAGCGGLFLTLQGSQCIVSLSVFKKERAKGKK